MSFIDFWNVWEVLHRRHVVNYSAKIISRSRFDSGTKNRIRGPVLKCVTVTSTLNKINEMYLLPFYSD